MPCFIQRGALYRVTIPCGNNPWPRGDGSGTLGSWWAATVATYCPSRMAQQPKSKSTGGFYHTEWSHCTRMLVQRRAAS